MPNTNGSGGGGGGRNGDAAAPRDEVSDRGVLSAGLSGGGFGCDVWMVSSGLVFLGGASVGDGADVGERVSLPPSLPSRGLLEDMVTIFARVAASSPIRVVRDVDLQTGM
jgi:hypothetical protein